jgi:hypothetical protein
MAGKYHIKELIFLENHRLTRTTVYLLQSHKQAKYLLAADSGKQGLLSIFSDFFKNNSTDFSNFN